MLGFTGSGFWGFGILGFSGEGIRVCKRWEPEPKPTEHPRNLVAAMYEPTNPKTEAPVYEGSQQLEGT